MNYTRRVYDNTLGDGRAKRDSEGRWIILKTIEQARIDAVNGVPRGRHSERHDVRADALTFFCDWRYADYLELIGVDDADWPPGVGCWVRRIAHWSRVMHGYGFTRDEDCVIRAYEAGLLDDGGSWEDALELYYEIEVQGMDGDLEYLATNGLYNKQLSQKRWATLVRNLEDREWRISVGIIRKFIDGAYQDKAPENSHYTVLGLQELGIMSDGETITRYGKELFRKLAGLVQ